MTFEDPVTEAAKAFALSTAFWETAAQSTEQALRAGALFQNVEGVKVTSRLDGPFDPSMPMPW